MGGAGPHSSFRVRRSSAAQEGAASLGRVQHSSEGCTVAQKGAA